MNCFFCLMLLFAWYIRGCRDKFLLISRVSYLCPDTDALDDFLICLSALSTYSWTICQMVVVCLLLRIGYSRTSSLEGLMTRNACNDG